MKRHLQTAAALLLLLALVSCNSLLERGIQSRIHRQNSGMLEDHRMHVVLVGSGGPINNAERVATSTAIMAGGEFVLVDTGPGTLRNADLQNLPLSSLSAVFLTHFHSDHIADLGEANFQSWAAGRRKPLEIYGPGGVEEVVQGMIQFFSNTRGTSW